MQAIYLVLIFAMCQVISFCYCDVSLSKSAQETCPKDDPDCNTRSTVHQNLVQLQGVKTGFVQHLKIKEVTYKLITRSMKPLLFEIPGFLTEDECDHIVQLAEKEGLKESLTVDVKDALDNETEGKDEENNDEREKQVQRDTEYCEKILREYDTDENGQLSALELSNFFNESFSLDLLKEDDVNVMLEKLDMDKNRDGELSLQECIQVNVTAVNKYVENMEESHPLYKSRYSQQAWLHVDNESDPVLVDLQERVVQLTKLPRNMIEKSEDLQVVRYSVHGHFHAHYDSSFNKQKPCCIHIEEDESQVECNLCRFMTILYYLNNVTEGGETAFPVADNSTYDNEEYERQGLSNLSTHCHLANIVVQPVKGTAILWYNHHMNPDTQTMGSMDQYSLHGGCAVQKGVKWIANNWINSEMHNMEI